MSINNFQSLGQRVSSLEELAIAAPAAFATSPDGNVTSKYNFVPTVDIVKNIMDLGWDLHAGSQTGKGEHGRHMVRFTHPQMGYMSEIGKDKVKPQIILDNSHNRGSSAQIHMGLFRLVCTNGLVAAIPGMYNNVKFRHMGIDLVELKAVLDKAAEQYMNIGSHVAKMQDIKMLQDMKEEFAIAAIAAREPHLFVKDGNIDMKALVASTNPKDIIMPLRGEDAPDNLWTVFNVIQENMIKGGYKRIATNGRNSTTKGISSQTRNIELNKTLWTLAESYMPVEDAQIVLV